MRSSLFRRVRLVVAGTAAALASTAVLSVLPAQAGPPPLCHLKATVSQDGSAMVGTFFSICDDGSFGNPVTLQQKNPSTGVFVTVAGGEEGVARYQCTGTGFREYRTLPKISTKSAFCS